MVVSGGYVVAPFGNVAVQSIFAEDDVRHAGNVLEGAPRNSLAILRLLAPRHTPECWTLVTRERGKRKREIDQVCFSFDSRSRVSKTRPGSTSCSSSLVS